MDEIDKKLLVLLTGNARMPLKQLAEKVFLTSPAVSARIERLENAGIITGFKAIIDPSKLGYHITAFINLSMSPIHKPSFTECVNQCPNVVECYNVAGAFSMLIKVRFPSTAELDTFVVSLQKYGKTQTQIVFSSVIKPHQLDL
jgi:Transcriptional regulators